MMQLEHGAQELAREQCLALLPTASFGRLVFTRAALPAVLTVDFVTDLDAGGILVPTPAGSSVLAAVGSTVVAFQVDRLDAARSTGWTVTVVGRASVVRDPFPPVAGTFLHVDLDLVSGRTFGDPSAGGHVLLQGAGSRA